MLFDEEMPKKLFDLCSDLLINIFRFLSYDAIYQLYLVCKKSNRIIKTNSKKILRTIIEMEIIPKIIPLEIFKFQSRSLLICHLVLYTPMMKPFLDISGFQNYYSIRYQMLKIIDVNLNDIEFMKKHIFDRCNSVIDHHQNKNERLTIKFEDMIIKSMKFLNYVSMKEKFNIDFDSIDERLAYIRNKLN